MRAQNGLVHRVGIEAFRSVELQRVIDPQYVDRAQLGHHVGGDHHHDSVEAYLRADLLRHHFAEPSQQDAGTSRRAPHVPTSSLTKPTRLGNAGANPRKNNAFVISAASPARNWPNQLLQNCGTVCGGLFIRPYSQSKLALPSKTPASRV